MGATPAPRALVKRAGGLAVRRVRSAGIGIRRRLLPDRVRPPLFEGSMLDDLLFGQPVNTLMRLVHLLGRRRAATRFPVSVVVVSWNTLDVLRVTLAAVRRFSPPDTELIVVDNASMDGTREWLRSGAVDARIIRLPINVGHGRGLDIGFALARSPLVVTLDSDAFPVDPSWLDVLLQPIREDGRIAAGLWGRRDRLHPACAAYLRGAYFGAGISFTTYTPWLDRDEEPVFLENAWDTGELLFLRLGRERVHLFPAERTVYGGVHMADVVYHHEGVTTMTMFEDDARDPTSHRPAWDLAVKDLLG